jgi:hypothetical protein
VDLGVVDTIACGGEGLLSTDVAKGMNDVAALKFTIEGDVNYGTLEDLVVHQTGTASSDAFGEVELWLDANDDGLFSKTFDTRVAYQSYYHPGYRGNFDDLNDPEAGFNMGVGYEQFPPVYFDDSGIAQFHEIVVPTIPGEPRTLFVVTDITSAAVTGSTVQIGILSADDVTVKAPDQVSPIGFPIQTDEVPVVGRWLDPIQLTTTPPGTDLWYSWRPETAVCLVTGNVYVVWDSNRNGDGDVFLQRSTDQGTTFENPVQLDSSTANEFYPDVQVDSVGTVHVVYYSTQISANNREVFYVRSKDFGQTFEAPVRLTNAPRDSRLPKLAIAPDDSLNVAWHDDRDANNDYDIYFMKSIDGGDTWGDTVQVCNTAPVSQEVAITVGGDGVIHITWEEPSGYSGGNVYYSQSTDGGLTFTSPFKINSGTFNNRGLHSDVGADDKGNVYVVFHYVPGGYSDADIVCRISHDSGANWDPAFSLMDNSLPDSRPGISVRPDGSFVDIVFRRLEAESWNIYHTHSDDGMATWSEPVNISFSLAGGATEPVVVRGANFNVFAFWYDVVDANGDSEVFYNRFIY